MQSGNGMTMQEAEQEIKYYQKIFQVVRLLKGEDVERTFYQQGKRNVRKCAGMDVRATVSGRKTVSAKTAVPIKRCAKRSRCISWNFWNQKSIR